MWLKPQESFYDRRQRALANYADNSVILESQYGEFKELWGYLGLAKGKNRRAFDTLRAILSKEQFDSFVKTKTFFVIGGTTGRKYLLKNYHSFNIIDTDTNTMYCAGQEGCPQLDRLAGQKLWLESEDELIFLEKANVRR